MDKECYLTCMNCGVDYKVTPRKRTQDIYNYKRNGSRYYCSEKCRLESRNFKSVNQTQCSNCGKLFYPCHNVKKNAKSSNRFCSRSCAVTYNNSHKITGNRRSKLEDWIEEQLSILYPNLEILYNDKTAIKSELDIYIPSLKIAVELNGIFHYEPIFGEDKLKRINENDNNKFHRCYEKGISLCVIDTSQQKYFKPNSSKKYLEIICKIIDEKSTPEL